MTKAEILTLYFLCSNKPDHLETLNDYVDQFDTIEKQFEAVLEQREQTKF